MAIVASVLLLAALWIGFYERPRTPTLPWKGDPKIADEQMIQDLPVLEDHDVLSNFEPLGELSAPEQEDSASDTKGTMRQEERGMANEDGMWNRFRCLPSGSQSRSAKLLETNSPVTLSCGGTNTI